MMAQRFSGRGQEGEISLGGVVDGTFDKKSDWILLGINIFNAENGITDIRR